jgi:hypothetical protein
MVHTNINRTLSDKTGEESHFGDGETEEEDVCPGDYEEKKRQNACKL